MRLRRLTISALPGIAQPGFTFEPGDAGITLVTGPNAIGKSSLARALKHLLGKDRKDPSDLFLEAEFESSDARWQVSRHGSQIQWRRDGEPTSPPALPSGGQISLYRLSMESLLADDQDDQALAGEIRKAVRGGFDLDAPRILLRKHWGRTEAGKLREAERQLAQVDAEYRALRAEEGQLPDLERRIQAAKEAAGRLETLRQGLKLHEVIGHRERCQDTFDQFPANMEKLQGDEAERLDAWTSRRAELAREISEEQRKLTSSEADWQASGFVMAKPEAETVAGIEERLRTLDRMASEFSQAREKAIEAEAALKDTQKHFEGGPEAPDLSPESFRQARAIVEPLLAAKTGLQELETRLSLAGEPPDDSKIDQFRAGVQTLRTWLAASDAASNPEQDREPPRLRLSVALALAVLAALAALIEQAWVALGSALAASAALLWALIKPGRRQKAAPSPADHARKAYEETGLEPPDTWTAEAVRQHLHQQIEQRLNALTLNRERAAEIPKLRLNIEQKSSEIEALESRKAALAQSIGFDPSLAGASFVRLVDLAGQRDQARRTCASRQQVLSALSADMGARLDAARKLLEPWRGADAPTLNTATPDQAIADLRVAFDHIKKRLQAASEAKTRMTHSEERIHDRQEQIRMLDANAQKLFNKVAVEPEQRDALDERLARLEDWQAASEALGDAKRDEAGLREALGAHENLIGSVERGEIEQLQDDLQDAMREAEGRDMLVQEKAEIEARLGAAGKEHRREAAAEALAAATQALAEKRDEALRCQATDLLLDEVAAQFADENEPKLLRRAKALFEQVTAHAFSLELDNDNRFSARDHAAQRRRELTELSSGTRMQLLLALRLAWTEAQEQGGESLPLFLDEALTTSDEARFAVMANTLTRLAEGGDRQIFYLSARRHECALWEQATGRRPALVDLEEVRFNQAREDAGEIRIEAPPALPPPDGQDATRYARTIGVPPLDPHREPGGVHLFYLLRDDLDLLYRLLDSWRVKTLGQLENLLARREAAENALPDPAVRKRLTLAARAARSWLRLWRQGRGRPVNRAVLENSGAVSARFIDEATEIAESLQDDGRALIEALRQHHLPRFHTSKIDELEQWLADEGYTDDQAVLAAEARQRLTLVDAAPSGDAEAAWVNQLVSVLEGAVAARTSGE